MERLRSGLPGRHQSWRELAEHSLTHDDIAGTADMATLGLLIPTRGRPANAARLARSIADTTRPGYTTPYFLLDHDDPELGNYLSQLRQVAPDPARMVMITPRGGPERMGPVLNWAAAALGTLFDYLGFMGDDHLPRTIGWDERLCRAIGTRPGVAYGNDLFQGERLPTAVVMTAAIVRVLGYMSPPPLVHLWIDDYWRELGQSLDHLVYLPDVIIEHLHPQAGGKAEVDASYLESGMNPELMQDDGWRWQQWRALSWEGEQGDRGRLIGALA
jgi:hypothetical protein